MAQLMEKNRRSFGDLFREAYGQDLQSRADRLDQWRLKSGLRREVGHPDYQHLAIGEQETGTAVTYFMDMRGFTKLAMSLDGGEVVRILQATLAASISCVEQYDGYLIDLTGDGLMAVFGGRASTDEVDAKNAVTTAAVMLRGIKEVICERLESQGDETVRAAVGLEYGEVNWTRIGLPGTSQVRPIAGVSFLAGKLSTAAYTDPWQAKMGQNLAAWVPDAYKTKARHYEFQRENRKYVHDLYLFDWEQYHDDYAPDPRGFAERALKERRLPTPKWPGGLEVERPKAPSILTPPRRDIRESPPFA
jgi:hypothetical protein